MHSATLNQYRHLPINRPFHAAVALNPSINHLVTLKPPLEPPINYLGSPSAHPFFSVSNTNSLNFAASAATHISTFPGGTGCPE